MKNYACAPVITHNTRAQASLNRAVPCPAPSTAEISRDSLLIFPVTEDGENF